MKVKMLAGKASATNAVVSHQIDSRSKSNTRERSSSATTNATTASYIPISFYVDKPSVPRHVLQELRMACKAIVEEVGPSDAEYNEILNTQDPLEKWKETNGKLGGTGLRKPREAEFDESKVASIPAQARKMLVPKIISGALPSGVSRSEGKGEVRDRDARLEVKSDARSSGRSDGRSSGRSNTSLEAQPVAYVPKNAARDFEKMYDRKSSTTLPLVESYRAVEPSRLADSARDSARTSASIIEAHPEPLRSHTDTHRPRNDVRHYRPTSGLTQRGTIARGRTAEIASSGAPMSINIPAKYTPKATDSPATLSAPLVSAVSRMSKTFPYPSPRTAEGVVSPLESITFAPFEPLAPFSGGLFSSDDYAIPSDEPILAELDGKQSAEDPEEPEVQAQMDAEKDLDDPEELHVELEIANDDKELVDDQVREAEFAGPMRIRTLAEIRAELESRPKTSAAACVDYHGPKLVSAGTSNSTSRSNTTYDPLRPATGLTSPNGTPGLDKISGLHHDSSRSLPLGPASSEADNVAKAWMAQELARRRDREGPHDSPLLSSPTTPMHRPMSRASRTTDQNDRPPSRAGSIASGIREYVRPRQSLESTRSATSRSSSSSRAKNGSWWRGAGANLRRKGSWASLRSGSRADDDDHRGRDGAPDLNRSLPPLPGLDQYKEKKPKLHISQLIARKKAAQNPQSVSHSRSRSRTAQIIAPIPLLHPPSSADPTKQLPRPMTREVTPTSRQERKRIEAQRKEQAKISREAIAAAAANPPDNIVSHAPRRTLSNSRGEKRIREISHEQRKSHHRTLPSPDVKQHLLPSTVASPSLSSSSPKDPAAAAASSAAAAAVASHRLHRTTSLGSRRIAPPINAIEVPDDPPRARTPPLASSQQQQRLSVHSRSSLNASTAAVMLPNHLSNSFFRASDFASMPAATAGSWARRDREVDEFDGVVAGGTSTANPSVNVAAGPSKSPTGLRAKGNVVGSAEANAGPGTSKTATEISPTGLGIVGAEDHIPDEILAPSKSVDQKLAVVAASTAPITRIGGVKSSPDSRRREGPLGSVPREREWVSKDDGGALGPRDPNGYVEGRGLKGRLSKLWGGEKKSKMVAAN